MKKLGLFLAASFVGLGVHGEILTPGEALQRIGNNYSNSGARRIAARLAIPDPTMTLLSDGQLPQLYVFTPSDGGLLLVSAESEVPAVLGYSETFTCAGSVADNLPPALMDMIDGYAIEIDAIRARLNENRGFRRVDAHRQIVKSHLNHVLTHLFRIVGIVGERLSVGNHDKYFIKLARVLQFDSAFKRAHKVS